MKVLIIGASGLLAKPVIGELNKSGFRLRLFSRSVNPSMFDKSYEVVQGDVFKPDDLERAMNGCDAVHISISTSDEVSAVKAIIDVARQKGLRLISYISGCTVSEETSWFPMIGNKVKAEKLITGSGIQYVIFRPTWFFESLDLLVRNGKAMVLGKQLHPYHWVAAGDFARMVATAYTKPEALNKIFYIFGPEQFLMKDLLERYCKHQYPGIKKVSVAPLWLLRLIATLTGNKELKGAVPLFAYFEKVKERGDPGDADSLLGKPETTFAQWVASKANL